MKYLKSLFIIFCILICNAAFGAYQLYADMDGVTLPYGTKIQLSMATDLTTQQAVAGDMFEAYLTKDIYVNSKLILPAKTLFRGRVSGINYSANLSRPASIYLKLDHLVTKKGAQLPIYSGLSSGFEYILKSDGAITTNGNYFVAVGRDLKKSAQLVKNAVEWGMDTSGNSTAAKIILVPVGAIGGTVACIGSGAYNTIADLFRHGDEIIINKNSTFEIILLNKLNIPS